MPLILPPYVAVSPDGKHILQEEFAYTYPGKGVTRWNITYAKQLVSAGFVIGLPIEIAREQMHAIITRNEFDIRKLVHVDDSEPGIAAPLVHKGQIIYQLIDGVHRCAKAYFGGRPFRAHLLTDKASRACWIDGPLELMPWGK